MSFNVVHYKERLILNFIISVTAYYKGIFPSREKTLVTIDILRYFGPRGEHSSCASLFRYSSVSADKRGNFREHFQPMPPQNASLRFRKGNVLFRSRAAALFAQSALPHTSNNEPVFCSAPNLPAPRISLLSFDPMQTEQSQARLRSISNSYVLVFS